MMHAVAIAFLLSMCIGEIRIVRKEHGAPESNAFSAPMDKNESNVQQMAEIAGLNAWSELPIELDWFMSRAFNKTVIFTIANSDYKGVLASWLKHIQSVGINEKQMSIVCIDDELSTALWKQGHECLLMDLGKNGSHFFGVSFLRHLIAYSLNSRGYDVMYTDADALWLRNPLTIMQSIVSEVAGPGIIGSRGTYPEYIYQAWGATLCTGVLFYHGRLPASFWWKLVAAEQQDKDTDDQRSFNDMLFKSGVVWRMGRLQYTESTNLSHGHVPALNLAVTLLPHNQFPRHCHGLHFEEVVILHCGTISGNATSKALDWDDKFMDMESKAETISLLTMMALYLCVFSISDSCCY